MEEYRIWMSDVHLVNDGGATPPGVELKSFSTLREAEKEAHDKKDLFHWVKIFKGELTRENLIEYYQGGRHYNHDGTSKR